MIKIRKIDGGEIFDLPSDYVIEAEKNNPLFSDKGSQTVPINFPASGKNNRMLDFPFRIDRAYKKDETIPVIVETGSVQQKGLLSVNSATNKIISANIGYDESEMYAVMKDIQLCDMPILNNTEYIKSFGGNNIDERIDSMLDHLTAVMKEEIEEDYCIFPVIIKKEIVQTENNNKTYLEIINDIDTNNLQNESIAKLKALTNRTILRYENGEEIELSAPKGYGVSPFLKVYRILEIIFLNFGFIISENPFKDHRQLKKLVVLNNTIDAVFTGVLYYKDLMPNSTIQEFLNSLYAKFGMKFFVNSNSRTVNITFIKDLIDPNNLNSAINLNLNKTEEPEISFQPQKQLRLKMNREQEDAKVLFDTMEEFLNKYDNKFTESPFYLPNNVSQGFMTAYSMYRIYNIFNIDNTMFENFSDFFDWDKKTKNIEYEDIEMKDLCLPLYYPLDTNFSFNLVILQYLVGYKHQYSDIFIGGEKEDINQNQAKIAFAFAWGLVKPIHNNTPVQVRYFFASQFNRDNWGDFIIDENGIKYDISLTCNREDGLYNRFWKEYDSFLRHSNQPVICDLNLKNNEFINFKIDEKILINAQPLISEQIKYKFNNKKNNNSEAKFRTLRLYKPYDLEKEREIPSYEPQKYFWEWEEERTGTILHPEGTLYRQIFDRFYTIDGVQVPITYVSNRPPTHAQYIAQETRIFKYAEIWKLPLGLLTVVNITVTYKPALILL